MATHLHTKFTNDQVKKLRQKYVNREVERKNLQAILVVKKTVFYW